MFLARKEWDGNQGGIYKSSFVLQHGEECMREKEQKQETSQEAMVDVHGSDDSSYDSGGGNGTQRRRFPQGKPGGASPRILYRV